MEARLLRTLSDNGEPLPADQQTNQPLPLGVLDMLVEGPVAGVMVDPQLRVSSPASESSKAGESVYQTGTPTIATRVYSYVLYTTILYNAKLTVFPLSLRSQRATVKPVEQWATRTKGSTKSFATPKSRL